MRALFRSLPWNSRRGRDTSGRTWLRRLLIVAVPLLAVFGGVQTAREELVMLLYLLLGGIGLAVFLVRPLLMLFFVPIALSYPRTIPRLFGQIGIIEVFLPLAGVIWAANVISYRRRIWINEVLGLALLAAVPIVGSGVTGRGDQDWTRAYGWLGGCLTYLLALNLAHNRRTAQKTLLWTALVTVGVACLDFLTYGWLLTSQAVSSETYDYRKTAFGAATRQNNFVAALLALVMPILMAYALRAADRRQRIVGVIGVILGTVVGSLTLSLTFWAGMAFAFVALVYIHARRGGRRDILVTVLLVGASGWLVSLLIPGVAAQWPQRVEGMMDDWRQTSAVLRASAGEDPEVWMQIGFLPRLSRSVIQLRAAARSPLWGHGSNRISSGFAHAVIPTALYDYGLMFTLPLFGVLGTWFRQAIRLVRETDHEGDSVSSLAHLGVVAGVTGMIILNDFLLTASSYLCLAFFVAGLLGAIVSNQGQETVSED